MSNNKIEIHQQNAESWKVTLVDTGEDTATGGRLKRVSKFIKEEKEFCFTYGDGLSNVNIKSLIKFHRKHKKWATLTAVTPPGRFGAIELSGNAVQNFTEKPSGDGALINGGYFVLSPKCLNLIKDDAMAWEDVPLNRLVKKKELMAFKHKGFWQPMDTLREKQLLQSLWKSGKAPWKKWK